VVLGDSLSHGFKSFAIADTHLSWPAIVARFAGFDDFRFPRYPGPDRCQGLPFNLEAAVRRLEDKMPGSLADVLSDVDVAVRLRSLMDDVEDYWERGDGADLVARAAQSDGPVNHNLAVWGWDIRDALGLTVGALRKKVENAPGRGDDLLSQIPSAAGERSALLTLAGGADGDTAITLARSLGTQAGPGIETLVVALGANNILGTVLNFQVSWTGPDYQDLDAKNRYNAWAPSHFAREYDALVSEVESIDARHVIFVTVPHVTIAPMVRGVGDKMPGSRYFARYTRPWISDDVFSPNRHPCLTADQLRVLDFAVDRYNDHIVSRVREGRERGRDWRVFDLAGMVDGLAYRRFLVDEEARPPWWKPYPLPDAYRELSPQPDNRFFGSDRLGRYKGGLVALDGVHPTTIGYGLVAHEIMKVMAGAGVDMKAAEPDFRQLLADDSLVSRPPGRIASVLSFVELANRGVDLFQALSHKPPI
jgi:lysophospholipase L1-like esterase